MPVLLPTKPDTPPERLVRQRVYIQRRDLFGLIVGLQHDEAQAIKAALVKLEWPWDPEAEPESIELEALALVPACVPELVRALIDDFQRTAALADERGDENSAIAFESAAQVTAEAFDDFFKQVKDRPPPYRLLTDDVPTDRRLAWFSISDAVLVGILKGFREGGLRAFTVTEHALPPDARAIGYRFAGPAGTLCLLLHSQSFELLPDDVQAPTLPIPTIRVLPAALPIRQDRPPR